MMPPGDIEEEEELKLGIAIGLSNDKGSGMAPASGIFTRRGYAIGKAEYDRRNTDLKLKDDLILPPNNNLINDNYQKTNLPLIPKPDLITPPKDYTLGGIYNKQDIIQHPNYFLEISKKKY